MDVKYFNAIQNVSLYRLLQELICKELKRRKRKVIVPRDKSRLI
jgi:hypothetical protein